MYWNNAVSVHWFCGSFTLTKGFKTMDTRGQFGTGSLENENKTTFIGLSEVNLNSYGHPIWHALMGVPS